MRNLDNIIAGQGFELTLAGMSIVFSVLALIALCIAGIPYLLRLTNRFFPERAHHDHHDDFMPELPPPPLAERDIAALGFAWFLATRKADPKDTAA